MQNTGSNWQLIEETSRLLAQLNTALDVIAKKIHTGRFEHGANAELSPEQNRNFRVNIFRLIY